MPKYQYSKVIENKIVEGLLKGVSLSAIHRSCSHLQNCPRSFSGFTEKYAKIIRETEYQYKMYLGEKVRERINSGSDKILELELRSRGDRNPSIAVDHSVSASEDSMDAISTLAEMLKNRKKPDTQIDPEDGSE